MRERSVWRRACGLTRTVVEAVDFDDDVEAVIVSVRPAARARGRCGRCGRRSARFDRGEGRRRWRALDLGSTKVFLEADAPRVRCRTHGPTVAQVPWARHGAGHTRDFDDQAATPLDRPVRVRAGDTLRVTCTHDAALRSMIPELAGEQPRWVTWGEGTSDEMCLGIVQYTDS